MSILTAIASFFGKILAAILPSILKQAKEPGEVRQVGGSPETRDAVSDSIARSMDDDGEKE